MTPLGVRQYLGNQPTRRSPRRGPRRRAKPWCEGISAQSHARRQLLYRRIAGHLSRSFSAPIAIPAGPRNVVGPPTPGRVSGSGHIPAGFERALKHIEEAARHCSHAKTPPGESIGLRRSSTGCERVAGFGYRSPWWRVRGVQRPGVFEESLVPPAPDPRGTPTCRWGPGAHPPS